LASSEEQVIAEDRDGLVRGRRKRGEDSAMLDDELLEVRLRHFGTEDTFKLSYKYKQ